MTRLDCPDRTVYTDEVSRILAGKVYCELWGDAVDARGWPVSMYCEEILKREICPRGFRS